VPALFSAPATTSNTSGSEPDAGAGAGVVAPVAALTLWSLICKPRGGKQQTRAGVQTIQWHDTARALSLSRQHRRSGVHWDWSSRSDIGGLSRSAAVKGRGRPIGPDSPAIAHLFRQSKWEGAKCEHPGDRVTAH
jgi:hypothetical protein